MELVKRNIILKHTCISGSGNKFTIGLTDERNTHFQQSSGTNHVIAYSGHNSYLYGDAVSLYHDDIRKNGTVTAVMSYHHLLVVILWVLAFDADNQARFGLVEMVHG